MIPIKKLEGASISPFHQLKLSDYSVSEAAMGDKMVSGEVSTASLISSEEWMQDAFIDYKGEWWYIYEAPQRHKDNTKREYVYTLVFRPIQYTLKGIKFLDVVQGSQRSSGINNVQFYGNIDEMVSRIAANLNTKRGLSWDISVEAGIDTSKYVEVSLDDASIWEAIELIRDEYEFKFYILGKAIKIYDTSSSITYTNPVTSISTTLSLGSTITHEFGYGKIDGLYELSKVPTEEKLISYLRVVGSSKNLPYNYYRSSPRFASPYLGYAPNLLPPIFTEGAVGIPAFTQDYYSDAEQVALGNTNEEFIRFDESSDIKEIYPTIEGVTYGGIRIDRIKSVEDLGSDDFDESGKAIDSTFDITLNPLGFNISEAISTDGEMTISMRNGECAGANFKVLAINGRNINGVGNKKTLSLGVRDIATIDEMIDGYEEYYNIAGFTQEEGRETKFNISQVDWTDYTSLSNNSIPNETYTITIQPQLYNVTTSETIILLGGGVYTVSDTTPEDILVGEQLLLSQEVTSSGFAYLSPGVWSLRVKISVVTEESKVVNGKAYLRADFGGEEPFIEDEYSIYQAGIEDEDVTLTLQKSIDDFDDILPSSIVSLAAGDEFVIINIELPDNYVIAAEQRLEDETLKYLEENNFNKYLYSGKIFPPLLMDDETIEPNLHTGAKIKIKEHAEPLEITSYTMEKDAQDIFGVYSFQLKATSSKEYSRTALMYKDIQKIINDYRGQSIRISSFNREISNRADDLQKQLLAIQATTSSNSADLSGYVKKTGGEFTGTVIINKAIPNTLVFPELEPDIEAGEYAISLYSSGIGGETPTAGGVEYLIDLNDISISSPVNNQVLTYQNGYWVNTTLDISSSVSWSDITGKPTEFPPSDHTHPYHPEGGSALMDFVAKKLTSSTLLLPEGAPDVSAGEYAVSLLSSGLSGETPSQEIPQYTTDLSDILITTPTNDQVLTYENGIWVNKDVESASVSWNDVTGKPTEFVPTTHSHTASEVSGLGDLAAIDINSNTSTYLRGDGSWETPPIASYSTMSIAEGETATSSTSRVMRADYLKQIILHHSPAGSRPASDVYSWAKQYSKPSYTNEEVGAASTNGDITENFSANNMTANAVIINGYTLTIE